MTNYQVTCIQMTWDSTRSLIVWLMVTIFGNVHSGWPTANTHCFPKTHGVQGEPGVLRGILSRNPCLLADTEDRGFQTKRHLVERCSSALINIHRKSTARCVELIPAWLKLWETSASDIFNEVQHPGQRMSPWIFNRDGNPACLSVGMVKNQELKIAHVVLSQGANPLWKNQGGWTRREPCRYNSGVLEAESGLSHIWCTWIS